MQLVFGLIAAIGMSGLMAFGLAMAFLTDFFRAGGPSVFDMIARAPEIFWDERFYWIWGGMLLALLVGALVVKLRER